MANFFQRIREAFHKPNIESLSLKSAAVEGAGFRGNDTKIAREVDFEKGLSAPALSELRSQAGDLAAAARAPKIEHGGFLKDAIENGAKLEASSGTPRELFKGIVPEVSLAERAGAAVEKAIKQARANAANLADQGLEAGKAAARATAQAARQAVADAASLADQGLEAGKAATRATVQAAKQASADWSHTPQHTGFIKNVADGAAPAALSGEARELFKGIVPEASLAERAGAATVKASKQVGAQVVEFAKEAATYGEPQNLGVIKAAAQDAKPLVAQTAWTPDPKAAQHATQFLSSATLSEHPGQNSKGLFSRLTTGIKTVLAAIQEHHAQTKFAPSVVPRVKM